MEMLGKSIIVISLLHFVLKNISMSKLLNTGDGKSSCQLLQSLPSWKIWLELEETLPCPFTQLLARRLSALPHGLLMTLSPSEWREGEEVEGRGWDRSHSVFITQSQKRHHRFWCVLLVSGGLYKHVTTLRQGHWRPSWAVPIIAHPHSLPKPTKVSSHYSNS